MGSGISCEVRGERREMGCGRREMGDGRWEMGDGTWDKELKQLIFRR